MLRPLNEEQHNRNAHTTPDSLRFEVKREIKPHNNLLNIFSEFKKLSFIV